jgi:hypothetical protein
MPFSPGGPFAVVARAVAARLAARWQRIAVALSRGSENAQAWALAMEASRSLANRRWRLNQARVCSTTWRLTNNSRECFSSPACYFAQPWPYSADIDMDAKRRGHVGSTKCHALT